MPSTRLNKMFTRLICFLLSLLELKGNKKGSCVDSAMKCIERKSHIKVTNNDG